MLPLYYMSYPLVPWLVAAQWAKSCNYTPLSVSSDSSAGTSSKENVLRFPIERVRRSIRLAALYDKATS